MSAGRWSSCRASFWRDQVAAIPPSRRLFLLPHCLKHAEGCPADYDDFGLDCESCGACSIADFRGLAEKMGYKVLVAEGSPIVLKIIVSGHIDAIVGVACLNVLEKGDRQNPAGRHSLHCRAAALQRLSQHLGRRRLGQRHGPARPRTTDSHHPQLRPPDAHGVSNVRARGTRATRRSPAQWPTTLGSQRAKASPESTPSRRPKRSLTTF